MARIRTIKPEFFMSEDIGELTVNSRLLFVALWCHADRAGRMKFQRVALSAQCMPYEMDKFDDCLNELTEAGHVVMYEIEGRKYLYLPTFLTHQKPHNTERESTIPEFNGELTVKEPLEQRESPTGKGKGKGKGKGSGSDRVSRATTAPKDLEITQAMFEWAADKTPAVRNISAETDNFLDWHRSKGTTHKDWVAAWRTWMRKAQTFSSEKTGTADHRALRPL